jgi:hypothetical protein
MRKRSIFRLALHYTVLKSEVHTTQDFRTKNMQPRVQNKHLHSIRQPDCNHSIWKLPYQLQFNVWLLPVPKVTVTFHFLCIKQLHTSVPFVGLTHVNVILWTWSTVQLGVQTGKLRDWNHQSNGIERIWQSIYRTWVNFEHLRNSLKNWPSATTTKEDTGEIGIPQPNNNLWQVSYMSLKTCLSSSVGSHLNPSETKSSKYHRWNCIIGHNNICLYF